SSTHRLVWCVVVTSQRLLQWTYFSNFFPTLIPFQQLLGAPGQHSTDFPTLPLHPWNHHAVVPGGLVAHPGNDGSFGPLLDGDSLGPGHCPRANRRGMIGDSTGQSVSEIGVILMKAQERHDRPVKVFDVLGVGLLTAAGIGFLLLGEPF